MYPVPLYRGFLRALGLLRVAVHLDGLADLLLVDRLRLQREHWRVPHEDLHRAGATLRALRVVRRARVSALVVLVHSREQQRAVVHHHDVLRLVRLQQPFVLRPRHVLQRRVRFYVTLDHPRQTERQVLDRRGERNLCWIWEGKFDDLVSALSLGHL